MTTTPTTPSRKLAIGGAGMAAVLAIAGVIVAKWEPARDMRVGYWDVPGKVATACYGHTGGVVVGQRYSDAQCESWRRADLAQAAGIVNRCITVPLTDGQAAALVDATYNLGPAVVCGSTLQRLANAGQPAAVWCRQLMRWNRASGRELTGLTKRRADEVEVCLHTQE